MSDGALILDEVEKFIARYVVFPSEHCLTAVTLWAAHTHAAEAFYVTPRLVLDSAEPGSGKTRVLELLKLLTHNPKMSISTTTAALYRRLADGMLTILLDEVDAIFTKNAGPQAEDLRALLNSGYKAGATVDRCVGDGAKIKVVEFRVFAPVALAGLAGNLPPTITTRAVTIHMRKRASDETVEPFRERDAEVQAAPIRERLKAWIGKHALALGAARPEMPTRVVDRPAEVWEALLAVADAAGEEWGKRAREACEHFVLGSRRAPVSLGVRLLADLKEVFGGRDRMASTEILEKLVALDEAPWADMYGKALDARRLARELKRYEVAPVVFAVLGTKDKARGYTTFGTEDEGNAGLSDAWKRYLPAEVGNPRNRGNTAGQGVGAESVVTHASVTTQDPIPALSSEVTQVTQVTAAEGVAAP